MATLNRTYFSMYALMMISYYVTARNVPAAAKGADENNPARTELYPVATTERLATPKLSRYEQGLEDYDEQQERIRQARARSYRRQEGLMIPDGFFGDDHGHDHYHEHDSGHDHPPPPPPPTTPAPPPPPPPPPVGAGKAVVSDPWVGYYNFIINEGSWKFWAAFQLGTAVLLFYSACAAAYYAKYNFITADYDYGDYIFGRSLDGDDVPTTNSLTNSLSSWFGGLNMSTVQRIFNAISSKKYS